jgi:hypothetical protein
VRIYQRLSTGAFLFTAILAISFAPSTADAKKKPPATWQVSRVTDPITGTSTCVVAAMDKAAGLIFTQVGGLYPVVENNPVHGLLVGVSSGGKIRLPTGDILWRVDDKPFRELKANDNPPPASATAASVSGTDAASKAIQDAMAFTNRLTAGMTATSTVASGARAREMLTEMLTGQSLLFRAAAAAPAYGLPGSGTWQVGQITAKGLRPIPLDDSFRAGLLACGIDTARLTG